MTVERKLLVDLEEIKAIVLKCTTKECHARTVFSAENIDAMPQRCPNGHQWLWEASGDRPKIDSTIWCWLQLLKRVRDPESQNCGFKVFLEFEEANDK